MKRTIVLAAAAALTAVAAGGSIAYATGGSGEAVTGREAERAKTAALEAVGGGTVLEVERQDGDGPGAFEVEVRRADGSQVEVAVDEQYRAVRTERDDDAASEDPGGADTDD